MPSKKARSPIPPAPPEIQLPPAERIHVDPNTLRVSEYLIRDSISESALDRLTESVRNAGFARAATGMRSANGMIVLTSGKRLWLAAKRLQRDLPIDVRPEGPLVAVVEAILAHSHERRISPIEEGRLYRNALRDMQRVLGYPVTQAMLSAWLGVNSGTLSICLRIVRILTPEFARKCGIEFIAVKQLPRIALYEVAKIPGERTRAAHLIKKVTGSWPHWFNTQQADQHLPPFSRRAYGQRITYSIRDRSGISDAEMEELITLIRSDVEIARPATEADAAA